MMVSNECFVCYDYIVVSRPKNEEKLKTLSYVSTNNPYNNVVFSTLLHSTAPLNTDPNINQFLDTYISFKNKRQPNSLKSV